MIIQQLNLWVTDKITEQYYFWKSLYLNEVNAIGKQINFLPPLIQIPAINKKAMLFIKKFREKVILSLEDEAFLVEQISTIKLKKGEHFLRSGEISRNMSFIEKGVLRAYVINPQGNENVVLFGLEGWTMGDLNSFVKQEPASYNVDALEDTELVLISYAAHQKLLNGLPCYETYIRILMTDAYMALQKRVAQAISLSLEERYRIFMESYPNIALRVPQYMIAFYLGISPETLSRIRAKKL